MAKTKVLKSFPNGVSEIIDFTTLVEVSMPRRIDDRRVAGDVELDAVIASRDGSGQQLERRRLDVQPAHFERPLLLGRSRWHFLLRSGRKSDLFTQRYFKHRVCLVL